MAVPSPADCDDPHFVILLEEILIYSAVLLEYHDASGLVWTFFVGELVKKEIKIATSHQKQHAGTYYIHMYIVRKYLNKKMALFKICQWHTLLEWKCRSSMSSDPLWSDQGIH